MNAESSIHISQFTPNDKEKWDVYCDTRYASYASYARWYDLLPQLGYKPVFLAAKDRQGQIVGVLPAALSLLLGRRYGVSTWADGRMYAGPIADNSEIAKELVCVFERICRKSNAALIRIMPQPWGVNSEDVGSALVELGYVARPGNPANRHHTFVLDLKNGFDFVLKQLDRHNRYYYRRSFKDGLIVKEGEEHFTLDMYHCLKRQVWYRLGNMCPRKEEMAVIYSLPESDIQWWSAWYREKFVGASYCYRTPFSYALKGAIFDYDYPKLNINLRLYLDSIKSACSEGKLYYDFGSTPPPGSSHYAWKSKFRGMPYPITYYEKILSPPRVLLRKALLRFTYPLVRKYSYRLKHRERLLEWYEE